MTPDRGEALRASRQLAGQRKRTLVLAAVEALVQRGRVPTIAGVARDAGVGRKFIYDHPDLRAQIELKCAQAVHCRADDMVSAARVTGASLRADLENSRVANLRLQQRLRNLECRLSQLEGASLVGDDLLAGDVAADVAEQRLGERVAELERQLFETAEALRRSHEELDAARAINRELMAQANRVESHGSPPVADVGPSERGRTT
jgi:hypothetical protein